MLSGTNLTVGYRTGHPVLDGVDIHVPSGGVIGLAGPSGCGKTTLARVLGLLHRPWSGQITVDGSRVESFRHATPRAQRMAIGLVFQQPRASVNPRFTLRQIIAEPLHVTDHRGSAQQTNELAEQVGLTDELLKRRPHEVSDGQLQRACLARALALRPRYLICDEMTAMLDASTTATLVRLINERVRGEDLGVLAISHDDMLLRHWATNVVRIGSVAGTV